MGEDTGPGAVWCLSCCEVTKRSFFVVSVLTPTSNPTHGFSLLVLEPRLKAHWRGTCRRGARRNNRQAALRQIDVLIDGQK